MAFGSTLRSKSSIANDAYLTIQPGAGVEWEIRTLYGDGAFEVYDTDGSNDTLINSITTSTTGYSIEGFPQTITNTNYLKVKNKSGVTGYFGYNGMIISA